MSNQPDNKSPILHDDGISLNLDRLYSDLITDKFTGKWLYGFKVNELEDLTSASGSAELILEKPGNILHLTHVLSYPFRVSLLLRSFSSGNTDLYLFISKEYENHSCYNLFRRKKNTKFFSFQEFVDSIDILVSELNKRKLYPEDKRKDLANIFVVAEFPSCSEIQNQKISTALDYLLSEGPSSGIFFLCQSIYPLRSDTPLIHHFDTIQYGSQDRWGHNSEFIDSKPKIKKAIDSTLLNKPDFINSNGCHMRCPYLFPKEGMTVFADKETVLENKFLEHQITSIWKIPNGTKSEITQISSLLRF